MQANTFFNALLRPVVVRMTLDERMVKEQVPRHHHLMATKVLKSQETMHRAQVWRDLHPEWVCSTMERRWRTELVPKPRVVVLLQTEDPDLRILGLYK